ncbi:hypothetical protein DFS33DRAFT_1380810 [Desarmillaria ectypa]|nr:hypothetical protein DFS33DRAFT_1380810 [Desarmillaria ectypa]
MCRRLIEDEQDSGLRIYRIMYLDGHLNCDIDHVVKHSEIVRVGIQSSAAASLLSFSIWTARLIIKRPCRNLIPPLINVLLHIVIGIYFKINNTI